MIYKQIYDFIMEIGIGLGKIELYLYIKKECEQFLFIDLNPLLKSVIQSYSGSYTDYKGKQLSISVFGFSIYI